MPRPFLVTINETRSCIVWAEDLTEVLRRCCLLQRETASVVSHIDPADYPGLAVWPSR